MPRHDPLDQSGLASDAATHPGAVRKQNEDSLVHRPDLGLWAVADGAGGHGAGDVASQAVAAALEAIPPGLSAAEILAQARLRLAGVHAELQAQAAARSRADHRHDGGAAAGPARPFRLPLGR